MRPHAAGSHVDAPLPVEEIVPSHAERRAYERETFIYSTRALVVCAREFERLSAEVARRVALVDPALSGAQAEVRRAPGRCIVQLGPVALTVSWVRSRGDTAADGRVMIVEWRGIVGRSQERIPERGAPAPIREPATLVREDILIADATSEHDWRWRREDEAGSTYSSTEAAARAVDSLLESLRTAASAPDAR